MPFDETLPQDALSQDNTAEHAAAAGNVQTDESRPELADLEMLTWPRALASVPDDVLDLI
jgi:hypothetical protein